MRLQEPEKAPLLRKTVVILALTLWVVAACGADMKAEPAPEDPPDECRESTAAGEVRGRLATCRAELVSCRSRVEAREEPAPVPAPACPVPAESPAPRIPSGGFDPVTTPDPFLAVDAEGALRLWDGMNLSVVVPGRDWSFVGVTRTALFYEQSGTLWAIDLATREPHRLTELPAPVRSGFHGDRVWPFERVTVIVAGDTAFFVDLDSYSVGTQGSLGFVSDWELEDVRCAEHDGRIEVILGSGYDGPFGGYEESRSVPVKSRECVKGVRQKSAFVATKPCRWNPLDSGNGRVSWSIHGARWNINLQDGKTSRNIASGDFENWHVRKQTDTDVACQADPGNRYVLCEMSESLGGSLSNRPVWLDTVNGFTVVGDIWSTGEDGESTEPHWRSPSRCWVFAHGQLYGQQVPKLPLPPMRFLSWVPIAGTQSLASSQPEMALSPHSEAVRGEAVSSGLVRPASIAVYRARLSVRDHHNSKGVPLQDAAGIIRQDRAWVHRYQKSDPEDELDPVFSDFEARAAMGTMLEGVLTKEDARRILDTHPLIEVSIWPERLTIRFLD